MSLKNELEKDKALAVLTLITSAASVLYAYLGARKAVKALLAKQGA